MVIVCTKKILKFIFEISTMKVREGGVLGDLRHHNYLAVAKI